MKPALRIAGFTVVLVLVFVFVLVLVPVLVLVFVLVFVVVLVLVLVVGLVVVPVAPLFVVLVVAVVVLVVVELTLVLFVTAGCIHINYYWRCAICSRSSITAWNYNYSSIVRCRICCSRILFIVHVCSIHDWRSCTCIDTSD